MPISIGTQINNKKDNIVMLFFLNLFYKIQYGHS